MTLGSVFGQTKLPNYYSKGAQKTIDSLKKKGVDKILTYYRDTRKGGQELLDRKTFEQVNHIYTYIIWQDSSATDLNVIKFKDTKQFSSLLYCGYFSDIFTDYEKIKNEKDNVKKPLHLNYGDSYPFSNITLFNSNKSISFDLINEATKPESLSFRQFYFYYIQFCLLDLENKSSWH